MFYIGKVIWISLSLFSFFQIQVIINGYPCLRTFLPCCFKLIKLNQTNVLYHFHLYKSSITPNSAYWHLNRINFPLWRFDAPYFAYAIRGGERERKGENWSSLNSVQRIEVLPSISNERKCGDELLGEYWLNQCSFSRRICLLLIFCCLFLCRLMLVKE